MVVSAPAGSGKTVLLRSWISEAGLAGRAALVPSARDGHDPQRFWLSVVGALRYPPTPSRATFAACTPSSTPTAGPRLLRVPARWACSRLSREQGEAGRPWHRREPAWRLTRITASAMITARTGLLSGSHDAAIGKDRRDYPNGPTAARSLPVICWAPSPPVLPRARAGGRSGQPGDRRRADQRGGAQAELCGGDTREFQGLRRRQPWSQRSM